MKPLAFVASIIIVTTLVAWRGYVMKHPAPVRHIAILLDRSRSDASGCNAVAGVVQEALRNPGLDARSRIVVLATGCAASANEPVEVGRFGVPPHGRAMEGPESRSRRKQELLASVAGACALFPKTSVSPIYLAIRRAVEALSAAGCAGDSRCALYILTDGEETAEASIAHRLRPVLDKRESSVPRVAHEGIQVHVCGLAETFGEEGGRKKTAPRDAARASRLREVWTEVLGEDGVDFAPTCPKVDAAAPDAARGK